MDAIAIRSRALLVAKDLGFKIAETLPLTDLSLTTRSVEEIQNRALALATLVAVSYGCSRDVALSWLKHEQLIQMLTRAEVEFLLTGQGDVVAFQDQVEALCAFAWALNFLPILDFGKTCPDYLVTIFPNLKVNEPSTRFRQKSMLRPVGEIIQASDIACCLHWAIVEAELDRKSYPGKAPTYVITERRRALEWILSIDDWDEVSLDT